MVYQGKLELWTGELSDSRRLLARVSVVWNAWARSPPALSSPPLTADLRASATGGVVSASA